MLNRLIRLILGLLFLFLVQMFANEKQSIERSSPFWEQCLQSDIPEQPPVKFNYIPKRVGHYSRTEWATVIDSTWGPGLPTNSKILLFNSAWNTLNAEFAAFQGLDVDWDSLYTVYHDEIVNGVSRGRFAAIMNHLGLALKELHTFIEDKQVNWNTPLDPGVPLFVVGAWADNSHFGASLTPLPDSSLLVFKTLPNHPLGLVPGDIVLGYDGIPWKTLYREMLAAQLPIYHPYTMGSAESAISHNMLMSAGMNWHLFDTLDVVQYTTGDTLHFSTTLLADQSGFIWGNEQLDIPGVPWPEINGEDVFEWLDIANLEDFVSWGVIEGTQIGYIYVIAWFTNSQAPGSNTSEQFYNAIDSLMNTYETTGIILDIRLNYGAGDNRRDKQGLSLLYNSYIETVALDKRCGDPNDHFQMCPHTSWPSSVFAIPGHPMTLYDKPIAVLTGPGAESAGDFYALNMTFHPMARFFGKSTAGGFNLMSFYDLMGNPDWLISITPGNGYLVNDPDNYISRMESRVDEEVWLTPDDVAQGYDTVVEAAIEWIQNLAYAHDISVDKIYANPGTDTVTMNAEVENPNNHNLNVISYIMSSDSTEVDSIFLVDDGAHHDGGANDGIWGGSWPIQTGEVTYLVTVTTDDSTDGTSRTLPNVAWFTTIGPVVFDEITMITDTIAEPGDYISFQFALENLGSTGIAESITAELSSDDSCISALSLTGSFGDIGPGESNVIIGGGGLRISDSCPGNVDLTIMVDIFSNDYHFWTDSFNIHVHEPSIITTDIGLLPHEYSLSQNHPNPFNPITTIRYELPLQSDVQITIYDLVGREVTTLLSETQDAGYKSIQWDAINVASGMYFYQIRAGEFVQTRKMVVLK